METKTKLILAGVATTGLLGVCVAVHIRGKKRDHNAALFFSELERKISPDSVGLEENNAFDMYYWQNLQKTLNKPFYLVKMAQADSYAKDINDSWGIFNDDEDKINSVFRALKDQVAVSQIAYRYYLKTKINLIDDIRARMSKDEVGAILKIVNKLPEYRISTQSTPAPSSKKK